MAHKLGGTFTTPKHTVAALGIHFHSGSNAPRLPFSFFWILSSHPFCPTFIARFDGHDVHMAWTLFAKSPHANGFEVRSTKTHRTQLIMGPLSTRSLACTATRELAGILGHIVDTSHT